MMPKHEPTRAALYELLNALGYEAAASVLYVEKPGAVVSIACGSEDAMDSGVSVVLLERPSKPLNEVVAPFLSGPPIQGYA